MNKRVYVNPESLISPDLFDCYAIIFDTNCAGWKNNLKNLLDINKISKCKLFCLFGSSANQAEDIVDDWIISLGNNSLFFPTISDTDIEEIWYTIQAEKIVLLTFDSSLAQSVENLANDTLISNK
jgi:hypothetical protein